MALRIPAVSAAACVLAAVACPHAARATEGGASVYLLGSGGPATLRLHGMAEFDATNRLPGTAVWLDFSVPLSLQLPHAP